MGVNTPTLIKHHTLRSNRKHSFSPSLRGKMKTIYLDSDGDVEMLDFVYVPPPLDMDRGFMARFFPAYCGGGDDDNFALEFEVQMYREWTLCLNEAVKLAELGYGPAAGRRRELTMTRDAVFERRMRLEHTLAWLRDEEWYPEAIESLDGIE